MNAVVEAALSQVQPSSRGLYAQSDITGRGKFSKSHLYNLMARGQFPQPSVRCGPRFTRWSSAAVDQWFENPGAWMQSHRAVEEVA